MVTAPLMPRDRFFIEGVHTVGARVSLAPDDARKIVTVLRGHSGERVQLVDGGGCAFEAVLAVDGKTVEALLERSLGCRAVESPLRIVVAQGIPKGQKMDLIVEKATELGAAAIVPLHSDRVAGDRTGLQKRERWQRIAKSAAQQSGRTRIPRIEAVVDWPELIETFGSFDRIYIPWELAEPRPLRDRFETELREALSVLIVIGPEGGFTPAEVERAAAAGAVAISLGHRTLRTETAALVVLAALLYARGEL